MNYSWNARERNLRDSQDRNDEILGYANRLRFASGFVEREVEEKCNTFAFCREGIFSALKGKSLWPPLT